MSGLIFFVVGEGRWVLNSSLQTGLNIGTAIWGGEKRWLSNETTAQCFMSNKLRMSSLTVLVREPACPVR